MNLLQLQRREISELVAHPMHSRIYGEKESVAGLVSAIQRNGYVMPLVITQSNVVVSGYRRWRACMELGISEVDVFVQEFQDDDDIVWKMALGDSENRKTTNLQKARQAAALMKIIRKRRFAEQNNHVPIAELAYIGTRTIDGMTFHEIEGGFGAGVKSMLAVDIAKIHNKSIGNINTDVKRNYKWFAFGVDIIDIKESEIIDDFINHDILTQRSVNSAKNIYLFSESGYAKLLKIMKDTETWVQYEKLVREYFNKK